MLSQIFICFTFGEYWRYFQYPCVLICIFYFVSKEVLAILPIPLAFLQLFFDSYSGNFVLPLMSLCSHTFFFSPPYLKGYWQCCQSPLYSYSWFYFISKGVLAVPLIHLVLSQIFAMIWYYLFKPFEVEGNIYALGYISSFIYFVFIFGVVFILFRHHVAFVLFYFFSHSSTPICCTILLDTSSQEFFMCPHFL